MSEICFIHWSESALFGCLLLRVIEARCRTRCMSAGMSDGKFSLILVYFLFCTIDVTFAISAIALINLISFQVVRSFKEGDHSLFSRLAVIVIFPSKLKWLKVEPG